MEKITKEELMEKLGGENLSDEELEKVSGGDQQCLDTCLFLYDQDSPLYISCVGGCSNKLQNAE